MRKILFSVILVSSLCNYSFATTPKEIEAKQVGIIIAAGDYAIPMFMEKVKEEGSGTVIAERCQKAFPKDDNLQQICADSAQKQDLQIFINMTQAQKGN